MTWLTIDNVQRVVAPKAGNSELRFLYYANCNMVIYICIQFQDNISNSFQVTEWTQIYYKNQIFPSSKGHNSKTILTRVFLLVFCNSSHDALHLSFIRISGTVFNSQSGHKYIVDGYFQYLLFSKGHNCKSRLTRVKVPVF